MTEELTNPYRAVPTAPIAPPTPVVEDKNVRFWSRAPGKFVNKLTGADSTLNRGVSSTGPMFAGSVREWYETLVDVIDDAALTVRHRTNQMPQILECSPDFATILEHAAAYRPVYYADNNSPKETMKGAFGELVGVLNGKFYVHVSSELPASVAKLVLVTDKKVSRTKFTDQKKLEVKVEGKVVPSLFEDDWKVGAAFTEEPLPCLTRLDGITIKVLDMNLL